MTITASDEEIHEHLMNQDLIIAVSSRVSVQVSLKILLLLVELAGINNKAKANRDSCLEIIE